jgi:hypothetical protein
LICNELGLKEFDKKTVKENIECIIIDKNKINIKIKKQQAYDAISL